MIPESGTASTGDEMPGSGICQPAQKQMGLGEGGEETFYEPEATEILLRPENLAFRFCGGARGGGGGNQMA